MYEINNPDIIYNKIVNLLRDKMSFYINGLEDNDPIQMANEIIYSNTFYINSHEKVTYKDSINWVDTSKGRTYLRYLNSQFFIWKIIKAYQVTKDTTYLEKGLDIIYDWIEKYNNQYDNKIAYHKETTSLRMNVWIGFILISVNILGNEKLELLAEVMKDTAKLLANNEFYLTNTNQGMFQDIALILYSQVFTTDENVDYYIKLAYNRTKNYLEYIYTKEGIHKEHTPHYHYLVTDIIHNMYEIFKDDNYERVSYMDDLYKKSLKFSYQIVKPDGTMPQIGDNQPSKIIENEIISNLYKDDYFLYAITSGEKGKTPKEDIVVFKESGYAILRDSWQKKKKALYILFLAAQNSKTHKHSDDLSFLIYKGEDIVIEAGFIGYDYDDMYTQYAYSAYAHNTLVVDDESSLYRFDYNKKEKEVYINDYDIKSDKPYVVGINKRYEDVVHKRTITYEKNTTTIHIKDEITSKNKHNYKLLFNFGKNIKFNNEEIIKLSNTNKEIGLVSIESSCEYKKNIYWGAQVLDLNENQIIYPIISSQLEKEIVKNENFKGWNFPTRYEKEKNMVLEIEVNIDSFILSTKIILY